MFHMNQPHTCGVTAALCALTDTDVLADIRGFGCQYLTHLLACHLVNAKNE